LEFNNEVGKSLSNSSILDAINWRYCLVFVVFKKTLLVHILIKNYVDCLSVEKHIKLKKTTIWRRKPL